MTGEGSDPSDTDCEVLTVEAYKRAELGPNDSISQDEFIDYCRFKTDGGCQDLRVLMKSFGVLNDTPPEVATSDVAVPQSSPETEVRQRASEGGVRCNLRLAWRSGAVAPTLSTRAWLGVYALVQYDAKRVA